MFTDAKENLRIVSYFRGNDRTLGVVEGAEVRALLTVLILPHAAKSM
jgi:hypothetical protein